MADFRIDSGDRLPSLVITFEGGSGRVLTGATVRFSMTQMSGGPAVINHAVCVIEDATIKRVRYDWTAGDAALPNGEYWGDFEVTYSDTLVETFPKQPKLHISICRAL